jgi:hypothetical protein
MSDAALAFTFSEMIAAQEVELAKWEQWFLRQPASLLDLSIDLAKSEDLRSVLFHIFVVETYYAEPLNGSKRIPRFQEKMLHPSDGTYGAPLRSIGRGSAPSRTPDGLDARLHRESVDAVELATKGYVAIAATRLARSPKRRPAGRRINAKSIILPVPQRAFVRRDASASSPSRW